jgi:predicted nucleic acid-binding Zn ribbon protein
VKHASASRLEPVGSILRESLRALGWEGRVREEQVLTRWEEAVGPQIAAHARPSHVANRRLTVVTENPVWTQQLSLLRTDLLRRIARTFGEGVVTELFFVTGRLDPQPPPPAAPAPARRPAEIPQALEGEFAAIRDEEVREAIRSLCRAALSRGERDGGPGPA